MPLIRIRRALAVAPMLALGPLTACRRAPPDGVALVGATLIDGSGGPPLPDAVVVVRRGRIESVGTRAGFQLPAQTGEVDVTGRWIIPGLIDAHAHVEPWALPRYLAWGVTTVRDVHGAARFHARASASGSTSAPSPGRGSTAPGAMIDGLPTTYPDAIGANSPRDARKAVDRLVNAGVDLIKVYTRVDPTLLRAMLDEARTFNLRVAGHLGLTDAVTAAKEGIGSIEHLSGVPEASLADASSLYAAHYRGFFAGLDRLRAELGRARFGGARPGGEGAGRPQGDPGPDPRAARDVQPARRSGGAAATRCSARSPSWQQARWNVPDMVRRAGWTDAGLSRVPGRRARSRTSSSASSPPRAAGSPPAPTRPTSCSSPATASTASWSCWSGRASRRGTPCWRRPGTGRCSSASIRSASSPRARRPTSWSSPVTRWPTSATPSRSTASCRAALLLSADSIRKAW